MAGKEAQTAERDSAHLKYDYRHYDGRDWRFFEPVFARMKPTPPVLDVGSGLGLFLECCRHHNTVAVGVDSSEEGMIVCSRKGLAAVRADITMRLPFRDESIGSVLVHHVLEHIPIEKERAVLREIHRVLKVGGLVFVVSPNLHDPGATVDPDHINLFGPHQLASELRRAGFSRISLATNYWRAIWGESSSQGRMKSIVSGILWKIMPIDRRAASSSALAWK